MPDARTWPAYSQVSTAVRARVLIIPGSWVRVPPGPRPANTRVLGPVRRPYRIESPTGPNAYRATRSCAFLASSSLILPGDLNQVGADQLQPGSAGTRTSRPE